jgi:hypothetical protein
MLGPPFLVDISEVKEGGKKASLSKKPFAVVFVPLQRTRYIFRDSYLQIALQKHCLKLTGCYQGITFGSVAKIT